MAPGLTASIDAMDRPATLPGVASPAFDASLRLTVRESVLLGAVLLSVGIGAMVRHYRFAHPAAPAPPAVPAAEAGPTPS
jgi:hypothetical protein